jgi:hypothetical protein
MMVTVLVALFMGALAVGLAYVVIKPEPGPRAALFGIAVVLLLIIGQFVGYKYVRPHVQSAMAGPSLADIPLYRAIKKYEPAMYERLDTSFKTAVREGNQTVFMQSAMAEVAQLAQKNMASASNDSVHGFMKHAVVQLKELQRKPGDACFRFLFPQVSGPAELSNLLPQDMIEKNLTYLEAILVSAKEKPQQPPNESESMQKLQPILVHMSQTYGQDMGMLANPASPNIDRRRVCEISVELYDQILMLPKDDGADVLRFMISKI